MGMWEDTGISTAISVGRHLPQDMQTELFPSQNLQQSRGDLFQGPQGTCQGHHEPEPAPTGPHIPIWPVCPSALLGCWSWGSPLVLMVLRCSQGGGAGSMPERLGVCSPSHYCISEQNHQCCPGCCCQSQLLNRYNW